MNTIALEAHLARTDPAASPPPCRMADLDEIVRCICELVDRAGRVYLINGNRPIRDYSREGGGGDLDGDSLNAV